MHIFLVLPSTISLIIMFGSDDERITERFVSVRGRDHYEIGFEFFGKIYVRRVHNYRCSSTCFI